MNFLQSVSACFNKYLTSKGRATRSEFWWFCLFSTLMSWTASTVGEVTLGMGLELGSTIASTILQIAFLLPWLAVASRRMHDIDRSGWWILLMFTGIGIIFLIYWWAKKGNFGEITFGSPILFS